MTSFNRAHHTELSFGHVFGPWRAEMMQAARLAEEEANRVPVYEDKPIIARGWESETAADTAKEVRNFWIHSRYLKNGGIQ